MLKLKPIDFFPGELDGRLPIVNLLLRLLITWDFLLVLSGYIGLGVITALNVIILIIETGS